jgi:hypothetical protein
VTRTVVYLSKLFAELAQFGFKSGKNIDMGHKVSIAPTKSAEK